MEIDLTAVIVAILSTIVAPFLIMLIQQGRAWLIANRKREEFNLLRSLVREGVRYAEQKGFSGEEAFREARRRILQLAHERGLTVDFDAIIETLIEAGVWENSTGLSLLNTELEPIVTETEFDPLKTREFGTLELRGDG